MAARLSHLVSRFRELGVPAADEEGDSAFAAAVLTPSEMSLWSSMDPRDRRHSVDVSRRFVASCPGAKREEVAAALLHDVGKAAVKLGRIGRSIATLVPLTSQMRRYRDHERIGADMLRALPADPRTIELVSGAASDTVAKFLRAADEVVEVRRATDRRDNGQ